MKDLPVTDTYVHLWDPARFRYEWLDDNPDLNRAFMLTDYLKATESINVQRMVFMQCDALASQGQAEENWVAELAEEEQRIKGIFVDMKIADELPAFVPNRSLHVTVRYLTPTDRVRRPLRNNRAWRTHHKNLCV